MLPKLATNTVDVALLTIYDDALAVLLHRRPIPPDQGAWSLPGVIVQADETLEQAAARALRDKTGLDGVYLEQLYTFGDPDRHPRGRVITTTYYALIPAERLTSALAALPPDDLTIAPVADLPPLAFDHARIVNTAAERLRGKVGYTPVGYELLPATFTLRELRSVHEAIVAHPLNKDSFRRRLLEHAEVEPTGEWEAGTAYRPAQLYRRADTGSSIGRVPGETAADAAATPR
mgnify:CR=1 FL=1